MLVLQGGSEGDAAVHLQGFGPALVLVAALAVLHALEDKDTMEF